VQIIGVPIRDVPVLFVLFDQHSGVFEYLDQNSEHSCFLLTLLEQSKTLPQ
jgi:hypothetical protein